MPVQHLYTQTNSPVAAGWEMVSPPGSPAGHTPRRKQSPVSEPQRHYSSLGVRSMFAKMPFVNNKDRQEGGDHFSRSIRKTSSFHRSLPVRKTWGDLSSAPTIITQPRLVQPFSGRDADLLELCRLNPDSALRSIETAWRKEARKLPDGPRECLLGAVCISIRDPTADLTCACSSSDTVVFNLEALKASSHSVEKLRERMKAVIQMSNSVNSTSPAIGLDTNPAKNARPSSPHQASLSRPCHLQNPPPPYDHKTTHGPSSFAFRGHHISSPIHAPAHQTRHRLKNSWLKVV